MLYAIPLLVVDTKAETTEAQQVCVCMCVCPCVILGMLLLFAFYTKDTLVKTTT